MCDHNNIICISGDIVCTECAKVLQQDFDCPAQNITHKVYDDKWNNFFLNVCTNMNISDCIASETLSKFMKRINGGPICFKKKTVAAYMLYETMLQHNIGKTVDEIAFYTEVSPKAIWTIEKSFHCQFDDRAENYIEKFCYFLDLTRRDAAQIRKILNNSVLDIVEGCRPQNVAVAVIYYYCETNRIIKSLKNVSTICNVSVSSVQQIMKKLRNKLTSI